MGLLLTVLTAPLAPVRAVTWIGRTLQQEVHRQAYSPASVSRRLAELDRAQAAGELSERERLEAQRRIVGALAVAPDPAADPESR